MRTNIKLYKKTLYQRVFDFFQLINDKRAYFKKQDELLHKLEIENKKEELIEELRLLVLFTDDKQKNKVDCLERLYHLYEDDIPKKEIIYNILEREKLNIITNK